MEDFFVFGREGEEIFAVSAREFPDVPQLFLPMPENPDVFETNLKEEQFRILYRFLRGGDHLDSAAKIFVREIQNNRDLISTTKEILSLNLDEEEKQYRIVNVFSALEDRLDKKRYLTMSRPDQIAWEDYVFATFLLIAQHGLLSFLSPSWFPTFFFILFRSVNYFIQDNPLRVFQNQWGHLNERAMRDFRRALVSVKARSVEDPLGLLGDLIEARCFSVPIIEEKTWIETLSRIELPSLFSSRRNHVQPSIVDYPFLHHKNVTKYCNVPLEDWYSFVDSFGVRSINFVIPLREGGEWEGEFQNMNDKKYYLAFETRKGFTLGLLFEEEREEGYRAHLVFDFEFEHWPFIEEMDLDLDIVYFGKITLNIQPDARLNLSQLQEVASGEENKLVTPNWTTHSRKRKILYVVKDSREKNPRDNFLSVFLNVGVLSRFSEAFFQLSDPSIV